ncbi:Uu.00g040800.m01.CDS01 [Anthostomella pinea]|uniref:Uu.00g040800.m01.CDS01 n=1 Tax=Anthostomella pinea TaxID=933095 RepID=A0AAI8YDZ6_9PEZI|nr:Uu.00g040800.m01.CDS01 [Anthostomella pinea]
MPPSKPKANKAGKGSDVFTEEQNDLFKKHVKTHGPENRKEIASLLKALNLDGYDNVLTNDGANFGRIVDIKVKRKLYAVASNYTTGLKKVKTDSDDDAAVHNMTTPLQASGPSKGTSHKDTNKDTGPPTTDDDDWKKTVGLAKGRAAELHMDVHKLWATVKVLPSSGELRDVTRQIINAIKNFSEALDKHQRAIETGEVMSLD